MEGPLHHRWWQAFNPCDLDMGIAHLERQRSLGVVSIKERLGMCLVRRRDWTREMTMKKEDGRKQARDLANLLGRGFVTMQRRHRAS